MSLEFRREEDTDFRERLEELRESLRTLTPSKDALLSALRRLPGSDKLTAREKLAVLRGLERVWHMMRIMSLLGSYFRERIIFGGGAILNYIYMVRARKPPRLTFDLDASWYKRVLSKRVILEEMVRFNKWLYNTGNTLSIPVSVSGRAVRLYVVEYDVEKDYFPRLLSLRVPVITRYDGRPFYQFLGIKEYKVVSELRRVFSELLGVRDARIDYIRLDISLDPQSVPATILRDTDIFGFKQYVAITPIEYQLASKVLYKLGKDFGEALRYNLHDILKALLDLRLLDYTGREAVARYIGNLTHLRPTIRQNLKAVLTSGRRLWERNYHYTLVRKSHQLEDIAKLVATRLGIQ